MPAEPMPLTFAFDHGFIWILILFGLVVSLVVVFVVIPRSRRSGPRIMYSQGHEEENRRLQWENERLHSENQRLLEELHRSKSDQVREAK